MIVVMEQWQLVAALAGVILAGLSLAFGLWKFVHYQIQRGDQQIADRIKSESDTREKQIALLHERVSAVKDSTPTHDDIKRVEGYLERISSRIDQLVDMVIRHNSGGK